jgi:hypothetical protein
MTVLTRNKDAVPIWERMGLVSRFLLAGTETADLALTVTWVEVAPGAPLLELADVYDEGMLRPGRYAQQEV